MIFNWNGAFLLRIFLIGFILLEMSSCTSSTSGTWGNENIEQSVHDEMTKLNDRLFKALMANDVNGVRGLMSDTLLQIKESDLENTIREVSFGYHADSYRVIDEYYSKYAEINKGVTIPSVTKAGDEYSINYKNLNEETYVAAIVFEAQPIETMMFVVYGKYDNDWKVNVLRFGNYAFHKKNALDFFRMAKASNDKGNMMDAISNISLAMECSMPASTFIHYKAEAEMKSFYEDIIMKANAESPIPFTVESIESKPEVFRIFPEIQTELIRTTVCYKSNTSFADTLILQQEIGRVQQELEKKFKGFTEGKDIIAYKVYQEIPRQEDDGRYYSFLYRVNGN